MRKRGMDLSRTMRAEMTSSCIIRQSQAEGYKSLKEGQKVSFETETDPKNPNKLRAVNVCAL